MELLERVRSQKIHLSGTEREILSFILAEQEFVSDSTVSAVARRTFTSTSSVIRLTQKLGFAGFAELKFFIKNSLSRPMPSSQDLVETLRADVNATFDSLDNANLEPIVSALYQARTLYCFATGYAQRLAAKEFAKTLVSCKKFAPVLPTVHELRSSVDVMGPEDLVVFISLSGATEGLGDVIEDLRLRGIPVLCVAARTDGYIAQGADWTLTYTSTPTMTEFNSGLFHSFAGLTIVLDYVARLLLVHAEHHQKRATT